MREYHGALTPAEILAAMVNTAMDITGARASVGRDDVTGAGLLDANAAIGALQKAPEGTIDTPSGNVSITIGESVNFTGTGTSPDGNEPLSFFWDFGGGADNTAVEDPGQVVFNRAGAFTVTFTVSDNQGNSDTATVKVTVSIPVRVSGTGGGGGGGCTLDPHGAADYTLLIALGGILVYMVWRRRAGQRMY